MRDTEGKSVREAEVASPGKEQRPASRRPAARQTGREAAPEAGQEAARLPIPEATEPDVQPRAIAEGEIRELAYEIYLSRGATDGHDIDDWYAAERELRARSSP